jgi:predicted phosphodiesterase
MRIALISDIHYGALSSTSELAIQGEPLQDGTVSNASPLFQGLMNTLAQERPDYLFVTGDLTSTGSPLEFKNCFEKIHLLAETTCISPKNVLICLGNHDIDWRITRLVDTYTEKSVHLSEDVDFLEDAYCKLACGWPVREISKLPAGIAEFTLPYNDVPLAGVVEREDCIIFVLNSGHLCYHDESHKHGALSKKQLLWFHASVNKYTSSQKAKIVLLHHHPYNYPFPLIGRDASTLEEGSELYEICGKSGIDLVIHGHRHHPKAKTVNENGWIKPVTYVCAGSLSVNASHRLQGNIPNTFHIVEFENREKITMKNYEYSFTDGWMPIKGYREEVPLEETMLLGKTINLTDQTVTDLVKRLPINKKIYYSSLDNDLSYLYRSDLLKLAKEISGCDVYSEPDHFVIFRPRGGQG